MQPRHASVLLLAAAALPIAYFGAQVAAAPFFPEYSVFSTSASDLGSERSRLPVILNSGAVLTGVFGLAGAVGLGVALPRLSAPKYLSWLLAICVASIGLAAAWAGTHPLPDPHHDPGALGAGMFAAPFVSAWVAWKTAALKPLRMALLMNVGVFALCALVLSGAAGVSLSSYGGLAQKITALVCFVPPALVAFLSRKHVLSHSDA